MLPISHDELIGEHTHVHLICKTSKAWPPIDSREHQRNSPRAKTPETRSTKERRLERENLTSFEDDFFCIFFSLMNRAKKINRARSGAFFLRREDVNDMFNDCF